MSTQSLRVGFLGAGQMALAMAQGFVARGGIDGAAIRAADPYEAARERFAATIAGAQTFESNQEVVSDSDLIVLAVKPQMIEEVADSLKRLPQDKLLISILAGVTLKQLKGLFATPRLIRVMPNTPCLVGLAASAYAAGKDVSNEDIATAQRLLESTGLAVQVPEAQLDAVTGLSGSGPAFIYLLIEAMSDAGVRLGLPRTTALQLAAQTVKGAAEMVLATGEHPAALKDKVTSPGGTTIAGLHRLEQAGFRGAIMDAICVAAERSRELGAD